VQGRRRIFVDAAARGVPRIVENSRNPKEFFAFLLDVPPREAQH
jgi:hypothetical protein